MIGYLIYIKDNKVRTLYNYRTIKNLPLSGVDSNSMAKWPPSASLDSKHCTV